MNRRPSRWIPSLALLGVLGLAVLPPPASAEIALRPKGALWWPLIWVWWAPGRSSIPYFESAPAEAGVGIDPDGRALPAPPPLPVAEVQTDPPTEH
jgi:hypothetical protein